VVQERRLLLHSLEEEIEGFVLLGLRGLSYRRAVRILLEEEVVVVALMMLPLMVMMLLLLLLMMRVNWALRVRIDRALLMALYGMYRLRLLLLLLLGTWLWMRAGVVVELRQLLALLRCIRWLRIERRENRFYVFHLCGQRGRWMALLWR
jgi:hypothetical protein